MRILAVLLLGLLTTLPSYAQITFLADRALPRVRLRVGSGGSTINMVGFDVPVAQIGTGVPIAGDSTIRFRMVSRFSSPQVMSIQADSSAGLTSGTNFIPFSEIGWTSSGGDIPAGSFDGSVAQPIYNFTQSQRLTDFLSFSYLNNSIQPAGDYAGRVTYTVILP